VSATREGDYAPRANSSGVGVTILQPGERLELSRGTTAICIPVTAGVDLLHRCLETVVAHTPPGTPVLVVDRSQRDPAVERLLSELGRDLHYLVLPGSPGPVAQANAALEACADADAVLLASHALVFERWLDRLSAAGCSDSTVATASSLSSNAGALSVWGRHDPLRSDVDLERIAGDVAALSPRSVPRVPSAEGPCTWISRAALELVGGLDGDFGSLAPAVVDLAQRCVARGFVNVAADDVFVASVMPEPSAEADALGTDGDRARLDARYPYLRRALELDNWRPLERSLSTARRATGKLSVTVDARIVRGEFSGAQAVTIELVQTLARLEEVRVRVLIDPAVGADTRSVLEQTGAELLAADQVDGAVERSDVVHRPYQVSSAEDLDLLARLGERLVITHLDLIAFRNPSYFGSFEDWRYHRRVTRRALATADQVIFLSEHAAADAVREQLVQRDLVQVLPMVVNPDPPAPEQRPPAEVPEGPFLLCIGNDYRHKNRLFAIDLLTELRRQGWEGSLVLAGANVGHGSSRGEEAAHLGSHPDLEPFVHDLPAVSEAEKAWLYAHTSAVVYASLYEGFGLIPFEAAQAGKPTLFAPQASLAETLPVEAAVLVPWDAQASAKRALPLLTDEAERKRHVALVRSAAARMPDWEATARRLLEIYEQTAERMFREAALMAADAWRPEAEPAAGIRIERRRPVFSLLGALRRIGYRRPRR
jgi:glycosyltransferase involved in cell wall biosynthesis